jgi:hypothetical protein
VERVRDRGAVVELQRGVDDTVDLGDEDVAAQRALGVELGEAGEGVAVGAAGGAHHDGRRGESGHGHAPETVGGDAV